LDSDLFAAGFECRAIVIIQLVACAAALAALTSTGIGQVDTGFLQACSELRSLLFKLGALLIRQVLVGASRSTATADRTFRHRVATGIERFRILSATAALTAVATLAATLATTSTANLTAVGNLDSLFQHARTERVHRLHRCCGVLGSATSRDGNRSRSQHCHCGK
jgi:hypothetical protein